MNGLVRKIEANKVRVLVYNKGKMVAEMTFGNMFEEVKRQDNQGVLTDLTPQEFQY